MQASTPEKGQDRIPEISKQFMMRKVDSLALKLRRRQIVGSQAVAIAVILIFREIVSGAKYSGFEGLLNHLEFIGNLLQSAGPKEQVISNITKRVTKFLTEEYQTALSAFLSSNSTNNSSSIPSTPYTPGWGVSGQETPGSFFPERVDPFSLLGSSSNGNKRSLEGSFFDLLGHKNSTGGTKDLKSTWSPSPQLSQPSSPKSSSPSFGKPGVISGAGSNGGSSTEGLSVHVATMLTEEFSKKSMVLKPVFIDAIQELLEEVEGTVRSVGEQSLDYIHSGETILTIGKSRTIEAFLKNAARKRKFTVIVAETAPSFSGREMAVSLSKAGITTILIPDSSLFSLLPRCSKILLSPHLIFADGSLHSITGSLPLCTAAKILKVPVVICSGMFKFSAGYVDKGLEWGLRELGSPEEVFVQSGAGGGEEEVEVLNPRFDLVPAGLVDLYITNLGGHPGSLLYRLLGDMYGS